MAAVYNLAMANWLGHRFQPADWEKLAMRYAQTSLFAPPPDEQQQQHAQDPAPAGLSWSGRRRATASPADHASRHTQQPAAAPSAATAPCGAGGNPETPIMAYTVEQLAAIEAALASGQRWCSTTTGASSITA